MGRLGKQTELSKELVAKILEQLRLGMSVVRTLEYVGYSESSYYNWLAKGRRDKKDGKSNTYVSLLENVEKAQVEAQVSNLKNIKKVALGGYPIIETETIHDKDGNIQKTIIRKRKALPTWQASAWMNERLDPERWGRKDRHEFTGKEGKALNIRILDSVSLIKEDNERD